ncbi:hypothetical protein HZA44_00725 [Candidatus Peregrinibacteria bacterium]|nr:hypothetical protein [Candidatus Peregrinibacteria bacterium]
MPESNNPRSIKEVVADEVKTLTHRYPEASDQIMAYAEGIAHVVNQAIQSRVGMEAIPYLDEICSKLDFVEKHNLDGLPPEMQKHVTMVRNLVRKQILGGEILLEKIPVNPKRGPGSIEEAVVLAGTNA